MYNDLDVFKARALEEIRRATRYPSFVSLLLVDLSHINSPGEIENYQSFADFCDSVSRLVRESVRETDLVSSAGGGKIAVLLIETPQEGALALSSRLGKTIRYFLCNNTKSPASWRVPIKEGHFPDSRGNNDSLKAALDELSH